MYNYPINSKIFGKGKSFVLFLHGWGGSTNSFLSVANRLSNYHKVILIDFYGFGKTPFPNVALDTYEYATQVYLFLKNKNINTINIVAHSFGGRVAKILASVFNIKINKMVLVDSAGILPRRTLKYKFNVVKYKICKKLVKLKLVSKNKLLNYGSDEYKKLNNLQKLSYIKIVNQDLKFLLKYINCKTLLVWGVNDNSTPLYMAKIINKHIKNSVLYLYQNSGHFAYLENYIDFSNLLITFLKEE